MTRRPTLERRQANIRQAAQRLADDTAASSTPVATTTRGCLHQPWFDNPRLLRDLTEQLHIVSIAAIIAAEG